LLIRVAVDELSHAISLDVAVQQPSLARGFLRNQRDRSMLPSATAQIAQLWITLKLRGIFAPASILSEKSLQPPETSAQMSNIHKDPQNDLELLLPWHATGTLDRHDAERVERALAADRALLESFAFAREELAGTILLNESVGASSARMMEKLFAAIDADEPVSKRNVSFDLAGRFVSFIAGFSPRTLALATSVGAVAIVLQAGLITMGLTKHESRAAVAKGEIETRVQLASVAVGGGTLVAIRFAPTADISQINAFLLANRASMIDGPIIGGLYTIRVPETGKAKEDHIKQIEAQSGIVDFVAMLQ
jgi:hypothetical protein